MLIVTKFKAHGGWLRASGSGYTIYIHRLTSVLFYRAAANLLCNLHGISYAEFDRLEEGAGVAGAPRDRGKFQV